MTLNFPVNPSNGDIYDNYIWIEAEEAWRRLTTPPNTMLNNLEDVSIVTPVDRDSLVYDSATGSWINETISFRLDDLSNIEINDLLDNNLLKFDSVSQKWINDSYELGNLSGVTLSSLSSGNIFTYNGTTWVNGNTIVVAPNYDIGVTSSTNPSTYNLNFSGDTGLYSISINNDLTFTANNYRPGAIKTVRLTNGSTVRNLVFPTAWKFITIRPATITASKTGILSVTSFGDSESECVASYTEEP